VFIFSYELESHYLSSGMNTKDTVVVTGGTGFIASHLIVQLLEGGYSVICTSRDIHKDSPTMRFLWDLGKSYRNLRVIQLDLLDYDAVLATVSLSDGVFHTASPVKMATKDPHNEIINPAVLGTTNILKAAIDHAKIRKNSFKVVITSSDSAIVRSHSKSYNKSHCYTEADWNDTYSLRTYVIQLSNYCDKSLSLTQR
jgi:nucleoside-diphosphate-sugar epimerase